jgi:hypothetical protein
VTEDDDDDEVDATVEDFSEVDLRAPGGWLAHLKGPGSPAHLIRLLVTAALFLGAPIGALLLLLAGRSLGLAGGFAASTLALSVVWWRKAPR